MIKKVVCTEEMIQGQGEGYFILADSLTQKDRIQANAAGADLVYIDPPFFTGNRFFIRQKVGERGYLGDAACTVKIENDFDRFLGGKDEYFDFLKEAFLLCKDVMNDTASIYIHLDFHYAPYARMIADGIFGENNLLNEIVWHYRSGGRAKNFYSRKHDTILLYKKGKKAYFDADAVGEKRGREKRNNMKRSVDEEGRVYYSIVSAGKEYRYYEDSMLSPEDVWSDISHLQQRDPERVGYPTQKPEELILRILRASCPPGGTAVDIFGGSGTLAAAASKMGIRFVTADKSPFSCLNTKKRVVSRGGKLICQYPEAFLGKGEAELAAVINNNGNMRELYVTLMGYSQDQPCIVKEEIPSQISIYSAMAAGEPTMRTSGYKEGSGLAYVDYWSVGYIQDGKYITDSVSMRTSRSPSIKTTLVTGENTGIPCVNICDSYGNNTFFALHI